MIVRRCKTGGAFEAIPEKNIQLNFKNIKSRFEVLEDLPILIIIKCQGYEVTCYKNGKLMIKCNSIETAEEITKEVYENLF